MLSKGQRIANAVRKVESGYTPLRQQTRVNTWNPGLAWAKVTEEIPAGTFASPGVGEVQLYHRSPDGSWGPSGDPVPCLNRFNFGDSVSVDDYCLVGWIDGEWWYVNSDCPEPA